MPLSCMDFIAMQYIEIVQFYLHANFKMHLNLGRKNVKQIYIFDNIWLLQRDLKIGDKIIGKYFL